jgi:CO/xanthine dehydrogenase FAD-binding subunit
VTAARIALGAVGPHPLRAHRAEQVLIGTTLDAGAIAAAADAAEQDCEPFTDGIATDWYRRRMTRLFVGRALQQLAAGVATEDR